MKKEKEQVKDIKRYKYRFTYYKEMETHYKDLYEVCLGELRYEKLRLDNAKNIIDELHIITDEELIKAVIENYKNRDSLDMIIHSKMLFPNPEVVWKKWDMKNETKASMSPSKVSQRNGNKSKFVKQEEEQ